MKRKHLNNQQATLCFITFISITIALLSGCALKPVSIYDQSFLNTLRSKGKLAITDYDMNADDNGDGNVSFLEAASRNSSYMDSLQRDCIAEIENVLINTPSFSFIKRDSLTLSSYKICNRGKCLDTLTTLRLIKEHNLSACLKIYFVFTVTGFKSVNLRIFWSIIAPTNDQKELIKIITDTDSGILNVETGSMWSVPTVEDRKFRSAWIDLARKNAEKFVSLLEDYPNK